jgi:integrase
LLLTGARRGGVLKARWDQFRDGLWIKPGPTAKTKTVHEAPLSASARKAAGLEGVRTHDLRHTAASILVNGGASLPLIGSLLGHSQVSTTARYARLLEPFKSAILARTPGNQANVG